MDSKSALFEGNRVLLEEELQKAKHRSLIAARAGKYEQVALITLRIIQLTKLVSERSGPARIDFSCPPRFVPGEPVEFGGF